MSHADALRTWAGQYVTPAAREPFLAGADALDALTKVREVVALIDRLAQDRQNDADRLDWARDRSEGAAHAYTKAATFIREALGDTP